MLARRTGRGLLFNVKTQLNFVTGNVIEARRRWFSIELQTTVQPHFNPIARNASSAK
jgi:hypothetical protein